MKETIYNIDALSKLLKQLNTAFINVFLYVFVM